MNLSLQIWPYSISVHIIWIRLYIHTGIVLSIFFWVPRAPLMTRMEVIRWRTCCSNWHASTDHLQGTASIHTPVLICHCLDTHTTVHLSLLHTFTIVLTNSCLQLVMNHVVNLHHISNRLSFIQEEKLKLSIHDIEYTGSVTTFA